MRLWTLDRPGYAPLCSDCAFPVIRPILQVCVGLFPEFDHSPTSTEDGIEMYRRLVAVSGGPDLFVELPSGFCSKCHREIESAA